MRLNRCVAWRAPALDAGQRLLVGRARMSERHVVAVRDEVADEIERAVELRRDREIPTSGRAAAISVEDLRAGELALGSSLSARARRQAQALERLRAA